MRVLAAVQDHRGRLSRWNDIGLSGRHDEHDFEFEFNVFEEQYEPRPVVAFIAYMKEFVES